MVQGARIASHVHSAPELASVGSHAQATGRLGSTSSAFVNTWAGINAAGSSNHLAFTTEPAIAVTHGSGACTAGERLHEPLWKP